MLLVALMSVIASIPVEIRWEPFELKTEARSVACELGRLEVPENRKKNNGKKIEIAFVRLKSTAAKPGAPMIYLDGGPGSSAIGLAQNEIYMAAFEKFRAFGDVILLDQRGIGRSKPALMALASKPLSSDFFLSEEKMVGTFRERAKEAYESFEKRGVDTHAFNTEQSADDVNDLRMALGANKMNLLGFSYGTHLCLSIIRRHGAHVSGAVMIGTEGPDDTLKPPMEGDRQIDKLAKLVAKDEYWAPKIPDFKALVKRVLAKIEAAPVKVTINQSAGKGTELTVGKYGLQHLLIRDLGDNYDHPWFPISFFMADNGNWEMVRFLAEKRYRQYVLGTPLLAFVNDSASGASPERVKQAQQEAKTAIFGNAMNFVDELSESVGSPDLGPAYRSPIKTSVRSLFISGTLDWNTPPEQAERVRKGFSRSNHIIVENGGHESQLIDPAIQGAIIDFLNGKDVSKFKHALDSPKFQRPTSP